MEEYKAKQEAFFSTPNNSGVFDQKPPEKPKMTRLKENLPDRDAAEKAKEELEKAEPKK